MQAMEMESPKQEEEEPSNVNRWIAGGAALVVLVIVIVLLVVFLPGGEDPPTSPSPSPSPSPNPPLGCPALNNEAFDMDLPSYQKTITVPPIPPDSSSYAYATENALAVVPSACRNDFESDISDFEMINDRQPDGRTDMLYFRITAATGGFNILKRMLGSCSCGLVLNLHGSGGPGWDTIGQSAMLAAMGYVVVLPDSQTMPDAYNLKGRLPLKNVSDVKLDNWCGSYSAYDGNCSGFNKPMCYSTKVANILNDQVKYRQYVHRLYQIRKREVDYFVESQQDLLSAAPKLFLLGTSEGGMVASRYFHEMLDNKLSGTIINSWSCEFNYFTPCQLESRVCEHKCKTSVPQLNLIGDMDEFFGPTGSKASKVAESDNGYGKDLKGHCKAAYEARGFSDATVVVFTDAGHGPLYWNDNTMRSIMADFVAGVKPTALQSSVCTEDQGIYRCGSDGPLTCTGSKYKLNENATYNFTGTEEACSMQLASVVV